MNFKLKLVSMLLLASATCATSAEDIAPDAAGFFTCSVKNEAADTLYTTAATFAGARDKSKELAQAFADEVIKTHPEAGNLNMPMCNFGIEAKYAEMYLDQIKGQFSGDTQTVVFPPAS